MTPPRPPLPRQKSDGSRQWEHRHILAQVAWLHGVMGELEATLPATLNHVSDWTASPIANAAPDAVRVSGGGRNDDGTKGRIPALLLRGDTLTSLARTDKAKADALILIYALLRVGDQVEAIVRAKSRLAVVDMDDVPPAFTVPGAGVCANQACQRQVAGGADRLRAGRCDPCRKYRSRHGVERPAELCWPALATVEP